MIDGKTVCSFVCVWHGPRRGHPAPIHCAETQLIHIDQLSSIIDKVVFVVNRCQGVDDEKLMEGIKSSRLDLSIVYRDNIGGAYGAFNDMYAQFPDYDYYLFNEDDWLPVKKNYDTFLYETFIDRIGENGFLTEKVNVDQHARHACNFAGIMDKVGLDDIIRRLGALPCVTGPDYGGMESMQITLSRSFHKLEDHIDLTGALFYSSHRQIQDVGPEGVVWFPFQMIEEFDEYLYK